MAIFLTGSTGYLGSYIVAGLLTEHSDKLNLLVRAKSEQEARERLWQSLQLHFAFPEFLEHARGRVRIFRGDLTSERFGLDDEEPKTLKQIGECLGLTRERVRQIENEALSKLSESMQVE